MGINSMVNRSNVSEVYQPVLHWIQTNITTSRAVPTIIFIVFIKTEMSLASLLSARETTYRIVNLKQ